MRRNPLPIQSTGRHLRGFSLIEILVVITIIGALMAIAVPVYMNVQEQSRVTTCQSNLRQMALSLQTWKMRNDRQNWPRESGIKFLLVLVRDDMIDEKDTKVFLCPGPGDDNRAEGDSTPGSAYKDWDNLDSHNISYAGRDTKNHPINKSREGEEVIASDDNEGRNNHRNATCFVYADGVPAFFDRKTTAGDRGLEFADEEIVVVGEDSQVEELKKLQID